MNWKELYETNKHRKTQTIEVIHGDFMIKTTLKYFVEQYSYIILLSSISTIILFILLFHQNMRAMISSFVLLGFILLFSIFFHSFSIIGKKKKIVIKTNGQEIIIPYHNLKNLYLEENSIRICFKKYKQYSLIFLYETPTHHICDVSLPIHLLSPKQIENLFQQIEVKDCSINYQEKCIAYKRKRFFRKALLFIFLMILVFLISFLS